MATRKNGSRYMLCVKNDAYPVSLELRKIYRRIRDAGSEAHKLVRIIDESGEDYLFPASCFVPIDIPRAAMRAFVTTSYKHSKHMP
jgi:hypothetical protein